jgi:sterol 3beta-glucosyltransferase
MLTAATTASATSWTGFDFDGRPRGGAAAPLSGRDYPAAQNEHPQRTDPDEQITVKGALMKIGLAAIGTRGDVEPYVALTHALTEAGHEVTFAAPRDVAALAAGTDGQFVPMDVDLHAIVDSQQGRQWLGADDAGAFLDGLSQILADARSTISESVLTVADHSDILVTGVGIEDYGYAVAQARGMPIVPVHLVPWLPTGEYPHPLTSQDVPQDGEDTARRNLETFRMAEEVYWQGKRDDINGFRRSLGLPQAPCSLIGWIQELGLPMLQAFSGEVVPRPADWGPQCVLTGFWRLPTEVHRRIGESEVPEDLLGWLATGPPPVFIGFGSMPVLEPEKVVGAVAEAARLTGLRILIGAGWSDLSGPAASLPDDVRLTGAVDYDWLFPRCKAVIHHGGVGTTATGLTAGRPTWIFAGGVDMPFWGHRVATLGVGGYHKFTDFDLSHLTTALRELIREDVQQRAAALGERLRAEDGLADAVRIIEKIAG